MARIMGPLLAVGRVIAKINRGFSAVQLHHLGDNFIEEIPVMSYDDDAAFIV